MNSRLDDGAGAACGDASAVYQEEVANIWRCKHFGCYSCYRRIIKYL